jgi:hypothetical protein
VIYSFDHIALFSHSFVHLLGTLDTKCNLIYLSSTEHYEALCQQDKPNVYECIKNEKGKQ